jgi:hypothetical protein
LATLIGAAVLMVASTALATQLSGYIDFTGQDLLTKSGPGQVTIGTAQTISFTNPVSVSVAAGDFASIPVGTHANLTGFTFDPVLTPNPVDPLWTLTFAGTTYTFELTSLEVTRTDKMLDLFGTGILHADGYDDTVGVWDLTTQSATGAVKGSLSFSSDTSPVPEPGTMMLLGAGFLGLAIYGKRRKNA